MRAPAPAPRTATPQRRTAPRPTRKRRTRADYLDAALALANRRAHVAPAPYAYAVAHVDVAQVAAAAGVSRTALYRLWETQEAFRADLAAYLAATDDAPWMALHTGRFAAPLAYPHQLHEMARRRLNADQAQLATDPRPLLRAGVAGYPDAAPVIAVIAARERARIDRHGTLVERALRSVGRRGAPGVTPGGVSMVANCLADGLALASRMTPPSVPLAVGAVRGDSAVRGDPPWSLLALAVCAVFHGMTRPGRQTAVIDLRRTATRPVTVDPGPPPTGRRLDYLRLAARLATEPLHGQVDRSGLGYVNLDALARAEGVTRAAVRKLWPTQSAFRSDLCVHLLGLHREEVVRRLHEAIGAGRRRGDLLRQAGEALLAQAVGDRGQVSHLTFAPQLVLPGFREDLHRGAGPLLDAVSTALTALLSAVGRRPRPTLAGRRLAVVVLALVDGMTRMVRTHPELAEAPARHVLGFAFEQLLLGLSVPDTAGDAPLPPSAPARPRRPR